MHNWLRDSQACGITSVANGPAISILEWHCRLGFAALPEKIVKRVLEELNVDEPGDCTEGELKDDLACAAMKAIHPEWSSEDAIRALRKGHTQMNLEAGKSLFIDDETMSWPRGRLRS